MLNAILAICARLSMTIICLSVGSAAFAESNALATALDQKGLRLISLGGVIDEYPVWSKDSSEIFINIHGDWIGVDLSRPQLGTADWAGRVIAVPTGKWDTRILAGSEVEDVASRSRSFDGLVRLADGTVVSVRAASLGTSISVTDANGTLVELGRTEMDNCFSPVASPDENLFAFICAGAGLFIGTTH
jgi:hypothetical protein